MRFILISLLVVAWAGAQEVDSLWYDNGDIFGDTHVAYFQGVYFDLDDFGFSSFELTQVHLTVASPDQDATVFFRVYSGDSMSPDSMLASEYFNLEEGTGYQEIIWELEEPLTMYDVFWVLQEDAPDAHGAGLAYDTDGPSGHSSRMDGDEWESFISGDFLVRCYSGEVGLDLTTWGTIKTLSQ
jgi:hypothetical protein